MIPEYEGDFSDDDTEMSFVKHLVLHFDIDRTITLDETEDFKNQKDLVYI